jgi:hypothetical protein
MTIIDMPNCVNLKYYYYFVSVLLLLMAIMDYILMNINVYIELIIFIYYCLYLD